MSSPLRPGDKVLRGRTDGTLDGRVHAEATVVDPSDMTSKPNASGGNAGNVGAPARPVSAAAGTGSGWEEATVDHRAGSSKRRPEAAPMVLRGRIAVIAGEDRGTEFELSSPRTSVGRGLDNQVVLKDTSVSRRHVVIVAEEGGFRIEDLDSGNGVLVNGDSIDRELVLEDGDELELGETVIKFSLLAADGTPAGVAIAEPEPLPAPPPPPRETKAQRPQPRYTPTVLPIPAPPSKSIELGTALPRRNAWHKAALFGGLAALGLALGGAIVTIFGGGSDSAPKPSAPTDPHDPRASSEPSASPTPVPPTPAQPSGVTVPDSAAVIAPPANVQPATRPEPRVTPLPPASPSSSNPRKPTRAAVQLGAEKTAFGLYKNKKFEEAVQTLRNAADSTPDDTDRLSAEAHDFAAVGAGYARGEAEAADNPASAMVAFEDALGADRRSGRGAHATELRAHLAQVTPRASVAYLAANRYEEARAACDLAASLGAQRDSQVVKVRAQLENIARDLYDKGVELERSNREQANTLFRRVLKIVPASSSWYTKAYASLSSPVNSGATGASGASGAPGDGKN